MLGLGNSLVTGGISPVFSPEDIGSPDLWLKFNRLIISDTNSDGSVTYNSPNYHYSPDLALVYGGDLTTLAMVDDDRIIAWNPFGSSSIQATQTTGAQKPKWDTAAADLGSLNFVTGKWMNLGSTITIAANTNFTIVYRFKPQDLSVTGSLLGNAANEFIRITSGTVFRIREDGDGGGNNNTDFTSGTTLATDKYITLIIVRSDDSTGNVNLFVRGADSGYFDANPEGTAFGSQAQLTEEIEISNIGASADNTAIIKAHIKDVIVWDGIAVTDAQREQLFDYIEAQI